MRESLRIVLGTRGSELARTQTKLVEDSLRAAWPELQIDTQIISTSGDKSGATVAVANFSGSQAGSLRHDSRAGRKGVFTREIEEALRQGEIDVAVHSAKDLPSETAAGLEIRATLPRASVEDLLLMKEPKNLATLAPSATIATGSVRRKHQLLRKRPDLRVVELRGNVPTRLRKLIDSDWDAIVLARAGLERLGCKLSSDSFDFERRCFHHEVLSTRDFVPAGGQGVIAIQVRNDDDAALRLIGPINHSETFSCLRAEREFLRLLQGDCNSPVGVFATIESEMITLRAQVFEESRTEPKTGFVYGKPEDLKTLANELIKIVKAH
jgi:hydroxymethylbilane synthase